MSFITGVDTIMYFVTKLTRRTQKLLALKAEWDLICFCFFLFSKANEHSRRNSFLFVVAVGMMSSMNKGML